MSRVQYSVLGDTAGQEGLRAAHGLRLVREAEEGTGVNLLPGGLYGFTYSPGLPNAPLFAVRRYRAFEIHKLADGQTFIVAFTDPETAQQLSASAADVTCRLHADPVENFTVLVSVPYARIRQHRQYAAPNQDGLVVVLTGLSGSLDHSDHEPT